MPDSKGSKDLKPSKLSSTVSEVTRDVVNRVDPDSVASAEQLRSQGMSRAASTAADSRSARLDSQSVFQGVVKTAKKGSDPLDRRATELATITMQNILVVAEALKQLPRRNSIDRAASLAKSVATNVGNRLTEPKGLRHERLKSERESRDAQQAAMRLREEVSKSLNVVNSPQNAVVQTLINEFLVSPLFLANKDIFQSTEQAIEGGKAFVSGQLRVNPELPSKIFAALDLLVKDPEAYKSKLARIAGVDAEVTQFSHGLQVALGKTVGIGNPSSDADVFFEFEMPFFKAGNDDASKDQEYILFNQYKDVLKFLMQSMVLSGRIIPSYVGANGNEPGKYVFKVKTLAGLTSIEVHEKVGMSLGLDDARIGKDIILVALDNSEDIELTQRGTIFYVGLPEDPEVLKKLHAFLKYAIEDLQKQHKQHKGLQNYLVRVEGKMKELGIKVEDSAVATVGLEDVSAKSEAHASKKATAPEVPRAATTTAPPTGLPPTAPPPGGAGKPKRQDRAKQPKPEVQPPDGSASTMAPSSPKGGKTSEQAAVSGSVNSVTPQPVATPVEAASKQAVAGVNLEKYVKLKNSGVPEGGVANAMIKDGLGFDHFKQLGYMNSKVDETWFVVKKPEPINFAKTTKPSGAPEKPSFMTEIATGATKLRRTDTHAQKPKTPPPPKGGGLVGSMTATPAFAAAAEAERKRLEDALNARRKALKDDDIDSDSDWEDDNHRPPR